MSGCPKARGDDIYKITLLVTSLAYIFCSVIQFSVLVLIVKRRGNWVAILLSIMYATAYAFKSVSFFLSDEKNAEIAFYIDCEGNKAELSVRYAYLGWIYYTAQVLFKLSHWKVSAIFLLTAISLRQTLEIERIQMTSQQKLLRARCSNQSIEEVLEENRSNLAQLEAVKKRGECLITAVKIYVILGIAVIIGLYILIYLSTKKLVEQKTIDKENATWLDLQTNWIILCYAINLFTALAIFRHLGKRHKMQIKTSQLAMAICLGFNVMLISFTQFASGGIQLELWTESPMSEYPRKALSWSIVLQSVSIVAATLNTLIISYLLLNIGRRKTQQISEEDQAPGSQEDSEYVAMRLKVIYQSNNLTITDSRSSLNSPSESALSFDAEVEEIEDDPDFKRFESNVDLWSDPKIKTLLMQEFDKYNQAACPNKGKDESWVNAQSNLVSTLYGGGRQYVKPSFVLRDRMSSNVEFDSNQLRKSKTSHSIDNGHERSQSNDLPVLEESLLSKSVMVLKR